jgi:hypothetical protein
MYPREIIARQEGRGRALALQLARTKNLLKAGCLIYEVVLPQRVEDDVLWFARVRGLWSRFGREGQWLDWWIAAPPPFHGEPIGCESAFFERHQAGALWELEARPSLLAKLASTHLYCFSRFIRRCTGRQATLDDLLAWRLGDRDVLGDETPPSYGAKRRGEFLAAPSNVVVLRELYLLFGHETEANRVTRKNWKERYIWLYRWVRAKKQYIRFDQGKCRLLLDANALEADRALPSAARIIPPPNRPWPGWKGHPPVNDSPRERVLPPGIATYEQ